MTDIPINKSAFLPVATSYKSLSSSRLNIASSKIFSDRLIVQVSHSSAVPTSYSSYSEPAQLQKKTEFYKGSKIYELSPAGKAAQSISPRFIDENNTNYARRLKETHPELSLKDYAVMADIWLSNMRKMPEFNYLTGRVLAVKAACPQKKEELATDYAHRLLVAYPRLKIEEISRLTGLIEPKLQYKQVFKKISPSAFKKLTPYLKHVETTTPRMNSESRSSYARRLKLKYPELTVGECSVIVECNENTLRRLCEFKNITAYAKAVKIAAPQILNETNTEYARRLKLNYPKLSISDVTGLTGINECHIRHMPEFKILSKLGEMAKSSTPRRPGETDLCYAKRLKLHHPALGFNDFSALSGINERRLRHMPGFRLLSEQGALAREATPRIIRETNPLYAKRLMREHPQLSIKDSSIISDVSENYLRKTVKRMRLNNDKSPKAAAEIIEISRPRSPPFIEQLNLAIMREMYRDELSIEEVLPYSLLNDNK